MIMLRYSYLFTYLNCFKESNFRVTDNESVLVPTNNFLHNNYTGLSPK